MAALNLGNSGSDPARPCDELIEEALTTVRLHLGMEVGYLSEFVDGAIVFRAIDAPGFEDLAQKGSHWPIEDTYCAHVSAGRLPHLIPDTSKNEFANSLPITSEIPIGSHVSVPIAREDGSLYGMFCCFSTEPDPSLNKRDLGVFEMFAGLVERLVRRQLMQDDRDAEDRERIGEVIRKQAFRMHVQPIVHMHDGAVRGYETLCRFDAPEFADAAALFAAADRVGRLPELEMLILQSMLRAVPKIPGTRYLAVNVSTRTVFSQGFVSLFDGQDLSRIVLEITEHEKIEDYDAFGKTLAPLREAGLRLAVDDAGMGHSGLHRIVQLQPDLIKLDRMLVNGIDGDPAKRLMCAAMAQYADETGAVLIAEGIETAAEVATLREIGITCGQGFYLARPAPIDSIRAG